MKKILFIVPPFYRFLGSHNNWISVGVATLAEILCQKGYDAKVYNCDYLDSKSYCNLTDLYTSSRNVNNVFLAEEIYSEIIGKIKEFSPDLIGISMVTGTAYSGLRIAELVKEHMKVPVIAGGPYVTLNLEDIVNNPYIDRFIVGEGENVIEEALFSKQRVIEGIPVENLDSLPFIQMERLLEPVDSTDFNIIMTSRGCNNSCIFCSSPVLWNHSVRYRSAESVLSEIKWRKEKYGVDKIYFIDDSFMANRERGLEICSGLEKLKIQWWCESTFSDLDDEVIESMKKAGCIRIKAGLEIADDTLLRKIGKNISLRRIEDNITLIKKHGINFSLYLLLGIPKATDSDYRKTLDFARKAGATYYSVSIVVPYKGTLLYKRYKDKIKTCNLNTLFHTNYELLKFWNLDEGILMEYLDLNNQNSFKRLD